MTKNVLAREMDSTTCKQPTDDPENSDTIVKELSPPIRKRYTAAELLKGLQFAGALNHETRWAREGGSVGRELS